MLLELPVMQLSSQGFSQAALCCILTPGALSPPASHLPVHSDPGLVEDDGALLALSLVGASQEIASR